MKKSDLKVARERAGLSQGALAKKLGVSLGSVSLWESGKGEPHGKNVGKVKRFIAGAAHAKPIVLKGLPKKARTPKRAAVQPTFGGEALTDRDPADYGFVTGRLDLTKKGRAKVEAVAHAAVSHDVEVRLATVRLMKLANVLRDSAPTRSLLESARTLGLSCDDLLATFAE